MKEEKLSAIEALQKHLDLKPSEAIVITIVGREAKCTISSDLAVADMLIMQKFLDDQINKRFQKMIENRYE